MPTLTLLLRVRNRRLFDQLLLPFSLSTRHFLRKTILQRTTPRACQKWLRKKTLKIVRQSASEKISAAQLISFPQWPKSKNIRQKSSYSTFLVGASLLIICFNVESLKNLFALSSANWDYDFLQILLQIPRLKKISDCIIALHMLQERSSTAHVYFYLSTSFNLRISLSSSTISLSPAAVTLV